MLAPKSENTQSANINHERPHSGLGGAMIKPWPQDEDGEVAMFTRLGGFLKSYRRVRKKAA